MEAWQGARGNRDPLEDAAQQHLGPPACCVKGLRRRREALGSRPGTPYLRVVGAHGPRAPLRAPGVALVGVGVGVILHLVVPRLHVEAGRAVPAGRGCHNPATAHLPGKRPAVATAEVPSASGLQEWGCGAMQQLGW